MAAYERVTLNRGGRNSRFDCIQYSFITTFTFMFLVNDSLVWRDKTVLQALEQWCTCFYCFL